MTVKALHHGAIKGSHLAHIHMKGANLLEQSVFMIHDGTLSDVVQRE